MYRVAICDDEVNQREWIKSVMIALSVKADLDFEIEMFGSGEQLVSHYERHETPFHLLILDIEMGGMNGIQAARRIRGLNNLDEQIIFLTSYPDYMLESFDVVTFHYLIKPVPTAVLEEKILKLCQYVQAHDKKFLIIKSGYEDIVLKYDDLISIEAAKSLTIKSKLRFTTVHQTYDSKGIIADFAAALQDHHFLQIHRSIIINLIHVRKFASGVVLMVNGLELPIGRSKVKEVKDRYTKFRIKKVDGDESD
ncbi:LytR/AlgR family response regulator transcription factor [Paenibacillus methanolicus]|uniref:DNA-binding LytR/AlgR family response regulator n=1 Tax=Paenibacillus methanolicus TaxID=582686 RepID=A0A5S5CDI3_9BACL|nr:LytTR family DNA-binding domain-containing protein [Paenibacillus methanolicus]TYP76562.1 DNA-binding LytR/AlgR family response regulator [Paenibacillus methanolicus]